MCAWQGFAARRCLKQPDTKTTEVGTVRMSRGGGQTGNRVWHSLHTNEELMMWVRVSETRGFRDFGTFGFGVWGLGFRV